MYISRYVLRTVAVPSGTWRLTCWSVQALVMITSGLLLVCFALLTVLCSQSEWWAWEASGEMTSFLCCAATHPVCLPCHWYSTRLILVVRFLCEIISFLWMRQMIAVFCRDFDCKNIQKHRVLIAFRHTRPKNTRHKNHIFRTSLPRPRLKLLFTVGFDCNMHELQDTKVLFVIASTPQALLEREIG